MTDGTVSVEPTIVSDVVRSLRDLDQYADMRERLEADAKEIWRIIHEVRARYQEAMDRELAPFMRHLMSINSAMPPVPMLVPSILPSTKWTAPVKL